jgi:hypothetical protein
MSQMPGAEQDQGRYAAPLTLPARQVHLAVLESFAGTGRAPSRAELERVARGQGTNPGAVLAELAGRNVLAFDGGGQVRAAYPFSPSPTPIQATWPGVAGSARGPAARGCCWSLLGTAAGRRWPRPEPWPGAGLGSRWPSCCSADSISGAPGKPEGRPPGDSGARTTCRRPPAPRPGHTAVTGGARGWRATLQAGPMGMYWPGRQVCWRRDGRRDAGRDWAR